MMTLGLESKEGALRSLGEAFPAEKLTEIRQELMDDAKADGALKLLQTEIQNEIASLTGMMAGPDGTAVPLPTGPEGQQMPPSPTGGSTPILDAAEAALQQGEAQVRERLVTEAYGTQIPQRRVPEDYEK